MKSSLRSAAAGALLAAALPVAAAPTIGGSALFTDNRSLVPELPTMLTGYVFFVSAQNVAPAGPGTTATARHSSGTGILYALEQTAGSVPANNYVRAVPYDALVQQAGVWNVTASDGSGSTTVPTHSLDDIRVMPILTGLAASGPALAPHVTWTGVNPVVYPSNFVCPGPCPSGIDTFTYAVEVRRMAGVGPVIYNSAGIPTTTTSFDLPAGILALGQSYLIGVKLNHLDWETVPPGTLVPFLENRSSAYLIYQPVPEPSTVLMLGAGLALLAGIARRRVAG